MRQYDGKGKHRADGGDDARAHDAHICHEHEEIIPEHVENTAEQDGLCGKGGVAVVAEERRQHLGDEEAGDDEFDGEHIFPRQGQKGLLRAEKRQQLTVEERNGDPRKKSQDARLDEGGGKILVGLFFADAGLAPHGAEQHGAADAGEQTQTVNDIPDRTDHRQRRRTGGTLIPAHHRGVHNAVNGGDQRAAKGGGEVLKIQRPDLVCQKIHW